MGLARSQRALARTPSQNLVASRQWDVLCEQRFWHPDRLRLSPCRRAPSGLARPVPVGRGLSPRLWAAVRRFIELLLRVGEERPATLTGPA